MEVLKQLADFRVQHFLNIEVNKAEAAQELKMQNRIEYVCLHAKSEEVKYESAHLIESQRSHFNPV